MRARIPAIICAAAAVIGGAGCSGSPVRPPPHQTHTSATAPVGTATQPRPESSPGCSTAAADSPRLSGTRTAMVTDPGTSPFGVVVTPDGRWALVALTTSIEVLRIGSALGPVQVRVLPVSASPVGETLTPDGRYLLAASGSGAVVISVARAEQGRPDAVIGTLTDPEGGGGAIEVAVSPDGRYAFVTQEDSKRARPLPGAEGHRPGR